MPPAAHVWLRNTAAVTYSTALGFLVVGLTWQTFSGWLPVTLVVVIGGLLAIRVTTLFGSITGAATLNWRAIWASGGVGVVAAALRWPSAASLAAAPPHFLLGPLFLSAVVASGLANRLPAPKTAHFYHTSRFARMLHFIQGVILFFMALPASLFWSWTRPSVVAVTISAFMLWKLWGACPVTLVENEARVREGRPIMPPDSGFVPDVLARFGVTITGDAVGVFLYGIGLSLCGWFGLSWLLAR